MPQGNQVLSQINECSPDVVKAMRAGIMKTGLAKLFSANVMADDPAEMFEHGKHVHSQFIHSHTGKLQQRLTGRRKQQGLDLPDELRKLHKQTPH